jgi:hypothetical protein
VAILFFAICITDVYQVCDPRNNLAIITILPRLAVVYAGQAALILSGLELMLLKKDNRTHEEI